MFLHCFDAGRLMLQPFSLQIIGEPEDHSLFSVPEKCENFSNPLYRPPGDRAGYKGSDADPKKYQFFFPAGKIQWIIHFCRIKRIQMIPSAARISHRHAAFRKIRPAEGEVIRYLLSPQKAFQFCFPHLFVLLPHPFLKPYTGKSQPARCKTCASYTR